MITADTVFLLGAGASVPYRFPTSAGLKEKICRELLTGHSLFALLRECGQADRFITDFRDAFQNSGVASIDAFIARRPKYQEIGELAIAASLAPIEAVKHLTSVDNRRANGGWYELLWNDMLAGALTTDELLRNPIKFLTFNYDRSLEQYLLNGIKHTFDLDECQAFEVLDRIPIHHVYGSLGDYDPVRGYQYGSTDHAELVDRVLNARKSIKTVPAARGSTDPVAATWLADAERIFVMGFGFDPTNCSRVGLPEALSRPRNRLTPIPVFASAFEQTSAEKRWCESNAGATEHAQLLWTNGDCLALLRDRRDTVSAP
jgi:hypothetical protein